MSLRFKLLIGVMALAGAASIGSAQGPGEGAVVPADDPHVWLEEVQGERALAWARAESARTLSAFQADRRYQSMYDRALEVLQARDRIPMVQMRADGLYNFWQDETHVRGIVRRTDLASYRTDQPSWETVLDVDALARAEGKSWVYQGMQCLPPEDTRCLVSLSDGGRDANVVREFDTTRRVFVEDGFDIPEGKQDVSWEDQDSLLIAREWGPGTMTESGYPFVIKRLRRGQSLDEAVEVFRGEADDVGAGAFVVRDSAGVGHATIAYRYLDAFRARFTVLRPGGNVTLALPERAALLGIVDGRLLARLNEPWQPSPGLAFSTDSIVSYDLDAWKADPLAAPPELVWAPGERQSLGSVATTKGRLVLSILDNVRGRAEVLDYVDGRWRSTPVALPANASISIATASDRSDQAMFTVTDYLTPTTLWFHDSEEGRLEIVKTTPPRFDASGHVVEQLEATSRDGTRIPYFLVRPRAMANDGSMPTLLYGYGGFQNALTPSYSATLGRLWLEQGNAYVVANLRGGGEFGPDWHQAAQRANKQRTWDDYIAVAEDLIRRNLTSPRRLGVIGGSQGGLLVGTAITQRPDLFNAAIVQVPLFDMLRYHLIGAGASWIGEYGDPRIAEERAWIEAYSPYQRLRRGVAYPMPFIHSSTADDRVTPVHGRKAAARLAEFGQPYYYYENMEGGHAAAANLPETARRLAMEYVYASQRLVD
ncbi:MAG TPA: prolyl oligopeptidase family serine peptidase [Allosphingosinicella sp.]|nr:prolyl oligopeptidase family serine peptidase [Allosphingosinicella sp.]